MKYSLITSVLASSITLANAQDGPLGIPGGTWALIISGVIICAMCYCVCCSQPRVDRTPR